MSKIVLFENKKDCCGCSACVNVCPKGAIEMSADENGFIYPVIDDEKCVECRICKKVCGYQKQTENLENICTWVAINQIDEMLKKSASGGAFSAIAEEVIENGGTVFGSAMILENNNLTPKHICINKLDDLNKLLGSKYVQSFIGDTYIQARKLLNEKKIVLFSGTPCQVAGLYGFLGNKNYDNLFTIDIICHGVPSAAFFQGYITELEKKKDGKITSFLFRDKQNGWGLMASATYSNTNGKIKKKLIDPKLSSYYSLFLSAKTYRMNCYSCPYAGLNRSGNITIGDYWGIQAQHPEYLDGTKANVDEKKGISCILVNNTHGTKLIEQYGNLLKLFPSTVKEAAEYNGQLNKPSTYSKDRETILEIYQEKGYAGVNAWYRKSFGIKYLVYILWGEMPSGIKKIIKKVLRHS